MTELTATDLAILAMQDSAERFEQFAHETLERSEAFQQECRDLAPLLEKLKNISIFKN